MPRSRKNWAQIRCSISFGWPGHEKKIKRSKSPSHPNCRYCTSHLRWIPILLTPWNEEYLPLEGQSYTFMVDLICLLLDQFPVRLHFHQRAFACIFIRECSLAFSSESWMFRSFSSLSLLEEYWKRLAQQNAENTISNENGPGLRTELYRLSRIWINLFAACVAAQS